MRVVVVGVGNPWRGDDGVGWAVLDALGPQLAGRAELVWTDGEPTRLLDAWDGADLAIVVDAVRSGAPPGTIHRIDPRRFCSRGCRPAGSHGLGVGHACRLAEALGRMPSRMEVIGIEVGETGLGGEIGASVAGAVDRLAACLAAAVDDLLDR